MIEINLLPGRKSRMELWLRISSVLFLVSFLLLWGLDWSNGRLEQNPGVRGGQNSQTVKVLKESAEPDRLKAEIAGLDAKIAQLSEGVPERALFLLHRLAEGFPENIWLTKIEVQEKGELLLRGESMDYKQIISWMNILKGMEGVGHVELLSFEGQEILQFSIALEMEGGAG